VTNEGKVRGSSSDSTPASTPASSPPGFAGGRDAADAAAGDRAGVHAAAEHAARDHDPAAEFQRAAEPDGLPEPEHVVIDGHRSAGAGTGLLHTRVAGRLLTTPNTPAG